MAVFSTLSRFKSRRVEQQRAVALSDPDSSHDDALLVEAARHDADAFGVLFDRYHPRVFAYVAVRVGSAHDADVVTQEVFLRIVDGLAGYEYRGSGSFSAWVFRIAYHEAVRHVKTHRLRDVPIDDVPDIAGAGTDPELMMQLKEEFAAVRQAMLLLSPREQDVISMRYSAGLRNCEIADALGIAERTVAATLKRGLDGLRRALRFKQLLWVVESRDRK